MISHWSQIELRWNLCFFLELSGGKNAIVGVIYHPPDSVIKDFNESLTSSLDLVNNEDTLCYILGDFSINLFTNKLDTLTGDFLNILYSSYFFPLIHKSTRVKENSAALIDNILTNSLREGIKSGVLYSDLSDLFPIFQYSLIKVNRAKHTKMHKRVMSKSNISKFKYMLASDSWDDADFAYPNFMKVISFSFNECFPFGSPTTKYSQ